MEITEIPYGLIKDEKIYRLAWKDQPEREIGEVRDGNIEKSIQFFNEKFEELKNKITEVAEKIDATENKGSFLMKLVHLKEQLLTHDGLGNYDELHEKIEKYEELVKDIIQKNRVRNTEIKSALLEEAKQLSDILNWKEATEKANDLKARWIKTGSAESDKNNDLEEHYWNKISTFYDKKKQFYEDKQKLTEHRHRQYEELVKESHTLTDLHGKIRFEKVKSLKERWKELGGIPADLYNPLHEQFNKNLKGSKRPGSVKIDYHLLERELSAIKSGSKTFSKDELDRMKKELFKDRSRNEVKKQLLEMINLITERDFILKLAQKRFKDFSKMEKDKKAGIKKGILKDLIQRDKEDLKIYEENSANFSSSDGSMNKLVENKIRNQIRKIEVKSKLLEWIDSGDF